MNRTTEQLELAEILDAGVYDFSASGSGPAGKLPLTDEMLRHWSSGDMFGLTQNAGMGWSPAEMLGPQFAILSTQGGMRAADGSPIALGYHTGHFEVGLLVEAAAREIKAMGGVPFAGYCSDPCDGRTQGTRGMFDSLPYRNDAAIVLRRLARSLPQRKGVLGVATCDKGLPAMMMALASLHDIPSVLAPGGVMLASEGAEDTGKVQSIGARYVHGEISLEDAAAAGCAACSSAGGGCQFLGTAATSQVVAESLGMTLPHAALSPSGQPIWKDMARRSARALWRMAEKKLTLRDVLSEASFHNAMVTHAACGGSTNLVLHIPAIAHAAGLRVPTVDDWNRVNRSVPRFVSVLPNGPTQFPTARLFQAGGVPEVMLHLRELGLLRLDALTVVGESLGRVLEWWEGSERRRRLRRDLLERDGIDPQEVILPPAEARRRGLTSTMCFPTGNLCPEGAVIKATAIDSTVVDADGVYRHVGPARVFFTERDAIAAIKGQLDRRLAPGDVLVLAGRGPLGSGMEETYQLTSALKFIPWGKHIAVLTDARFSGVSTGACVGHMSPEALAGGPMGRLRDGDRIRIEIDRVNLTGRVDFVGEAAGDRELTAEEGGRILAGRSPRSELSADEHMPDDTRLWAGLQRVSGGAWSGCVYDVSKILAALEAGERVLRSERKE